MMIEKEKRRISIMLQEGFMVEGVIHINPGERVMDFINDARESFIAVTEVEFSKAFLPKSKLISKGNTIILNKSAVVWIKEI